MSDIRRFLLLAMMTVTMAIGAMAQNYVVASPDKRLAQIESLPRQQAINAMNKWLNDTEKEGGKAYKKLLASLEEMLSEPTWDYHNEQLFSLVMEHAATTSCLSDNERLRPQLLLDVTRKNAPGNVACDIEYETLDGTRGKVSDISSPYTLIYFNDPECLSCAKVKERLDTTMTLKNLVTDSILTVIGIYPYDNVEEWKLEPFPNYIINGIDINHEVDGQQTYDLMTMPMFYLLDSDKRVILKNEASLNRVIKALNILKGMENSDIETKLDAVFQMK